MQHLIRPKPPLGATGLINIVAVVGLVILLISQRAGGAVLQTVGLVVLIGAAVALIVLVVWWNRAKLVVDTDDVGLTAVSPSATARAEWRDVEAVTLADDELRIRRRDDPAVVLRLPTGANAAQVTAMITDLRQRLDLRDEAGTKERPRPDQERPEATP